MNATTTEIEAALARLAEQNAAQAVNLDETPRSPSEHRAAAERMRVAQAQLATAWTAHERLKNLDRQLADPEMVTPVFRDVLAEIEAEDAQAIDALERTHDDAERRRLTQAVEALEAEHTVLQRGPAQVSPSIVGLPPRLVQRLTARGVTSLPGCAHVFERRGGLLTLEPLLAGLHQQRAAAMEVLVRELELG
jgi:hypothetical protein